MLVLNAWKPLVAPGGAYGGEGRHLSVYEVKRRANLSNKKSENRLLTQQMVFTFLES